MRKIDWEIVNIIIGFVLIIGIVIFEIYLWVKYGNKPIDEIPSWVLWFMLGK